MTGPLSDHLSARIIRRHTTDTANVFSRLPGNSNIMYDVCNGHSGLNIQLLGVLFVGLPIHDKVSLSYRCTVILVMSYQDKAANISNIQI